MGFPWQKYWSELPFPSLGDLPDPGIKLMFPAWQVDSLPLNHLGSLTTRHILKYKNRNSRLVRLKYNNLWNFLIIRSIWISLTDMKDTEEKLLVYRRTRLVLQWVVIACCCFNSLCIHLFMMSIAFTKKNVILFSKLKYSWFTMLCLFHVHSKVTQLKVTDSFSDSLLWVITRYWVKFTVLYIMSLLVIYFMHSLVVSISINPKPLIYPSSPFPLW